MSSPAKKKRRFSATVKSLEHLRERGWQACVGEQNIQRVDRKTGKRIVFKRDLWGFGDLLVCHPERGLTALVQTTTGSHAADRIAKIIGIPEALGWLRCGNKVIVHSWRKIKAFRGSKAFTWQVDEREVVADDFPPHDSDLAGVETVPE